MDELLHLVSVLFYFSGVFCCCCSEDRCSEGGKWQCSRLICSVQGPARRYSSALYRIDERKLRHCIPCDSVLKNRNKIVLWKCKFCSYHHHQHHLKQQVVTSCRTIVQHLIHLTDIGANEKWNLEHSRKSMRNSVPTVVRGHGFLDREICFNYSNK